MELKPFLKNCKETGINALIIPDVPFEEHENLNPYVKNLILVLYP